MPVIADNSELLRLFNDASHGWNGGDKQDFNAKMQDNIKLILKNLSKDNAKIQKTIECINAGSATN